MNLITLLSDFGLRDATVAITKGILMQHIPNAVIIDISHELKPFYMPQAAYLLASAIGNFPAGTCHVVVFDLYSEQPSRIIFSEYEGQYFISPDNGLIPMALGVANISAWQYMEQGSSHTFTDWVAAAGQAVKKLQVKKPAELGFPAFRLKALPQKTPQLSSQGFVTCEAIHIDHYENVVINITKHQFEKLAGGRPFRMQFMEVEEIDAISNSYTDVREGYKLCRFNSNGYLEICINRGKAASLFGLRVGSRHNDIKIYFE